QQATPRAAVDAQGDPLPDGAVARLGTLRFNHGEGLNALYYSPDGKTIISEGNGFIRRWDATDGKALAEIPTPKPSFDDQTVLLADGNTLITLNQDNAGDTVRVWDLAEKRQTRNLTLPVRRSVSSVGHRNAFSPDGKLCACVSHTPAQTA